MLCPAPISTSVVIEKDLRSADFFVEFSLKKHRLALNERSDGPTLQSHAMPWAPATFCLLILVTNGLLPAKVDQDKIGIVALCEAAFADHIPDSRRRVAHPLNHTFQRADSCINAIQHQCERVFDGGES